MATDELSFSGSIMNQGGVGDGDGDNPASSIPLQKLSCDHCRARKVRCDRIEPCTPCTRKRITCTFPGGYKPRKKRQRALVSNSYEDKIDEISSKLDQICSILNTNPQSVSWTSQISHPSPFSRGAAASSSSYTHVPSSSAVADDEDVSGPESEGEMSLKAHAAYATEFVQKIVNSAPTGFTPDISSSLDALRKIVETSKQQSRKAKSQQPANLTDTATPTGEGLAMPPLEMAMTCLNMLKEHDRIKLFWCFEFDSITDFFEYFLSAYSNKPSMTDLIIVNAGLSRLFHECSCFEADSRVKAEYETQERSCHRNLDILVSRILHTAPYTFDLALALSMAATQLMNKLRSYLAWKLIVHSANICQCLGLNRGNSLGVESPAVYRRRKRLFFTVCVMEKYLAFRLGKPSTIRISEIPPIDVEMSDGFGTSMNPVWQKWMDISLLQDQVYDDLYSPRALLQPEVERVGRAHSLAGKLQKVFVTQDPAEAQFKQSVDDTFGDSMAELLWKADRITYLAILTLVYRTIPPETHTRSAFSQLCVTSALETLEAHQECMRLLEQQEHEMLDFYVQWALLSAPFLPYIVIFCLAVETSSPLYLDKLASVVDVLKRVNAGSRDAYKKQLAIFMLMYEVACKYVEVNTAGSRGAGETGKTPLSSGAMDLSYDASVGFPNQSFQTGHVSGQGMESEQVRPGTSSSGLELGTWLDQSYQILQMLDDDTYYGL